MRFGPLLPTRTNIRAEERGRSAFGFVLGDAKRPRQEAWRQPWPWQAGASAWPQPSAIDGALEGLPMKKQNQTADRKLSRTDVRISPTQWAGVTRYVVVGRSTGDKQLDAKKTGPLRAGA